ncbi:hypothetical protein BTN49_0767 [Candidatus Enterovibrio escicola]|uniref:Uncharacterized protein n=1 Tax=Candidatus Enterovibrio escicola TaxID=1927127 RepID=A0A2A5T6P4_9GAMM|nr:hypothetical protein BTN49_0767 [Candidatus Enterovibrio escacola]
MRQYVKKGTDLKRIKNEDITFAQARINHWFKKYLGVKHPAVIFKEMALAA